MKLWKLMNIVWSLILLGLIVVIMVRKVDGAGVVQTSAMRLLALAILAVFALIPLAVQVIWYRSLKKK